MVALVQVYTTPHVQALMCTDALTKTTVLEPRPPPQPATRIPHALPLPRDLVLLVEEVGGMRWWMALH